MLFPFLKKIRRSRSSRLEVSSFAIDDSGALELYDGFSSSACSLGLVEFAGLDSS